MNLAQPKFILEENLNEWLPRSGWTGDLSVETATSVNCFILSWRNEGPAHCKWCCFVGWALSCLRGRKVGWVRSRCRRHKWIYFSLPLAVAVVSPAPQALSLWLPSWWTITWSCTPNKSLSLSWFLPALFPLFIITKMPPEQV